MTITRAATSTTCRAPSPARTRTSATSISASRPNAAGTLPQRPAQRSGSRPAGCTLPPARAPQANNYSIAQKDFNPVTYQGARLSALYQINDDWNVLITESLQDLDAEGLSVEYPDRLRLPDAAAAAGHVVRAVLQQGQLFEHGLDRQRQDRRSQGGLYRRLHRPPHPRADGLHQLFAHGRRHVLPVLGRHDRLWAPGSAAAAIRRSATGRTRSTTPISATKSASARRTTGACAPSAAPIRKQFRI